MGQKYGITSGIANPRSVVSGETYQLTVLTEQLICMEYSPREEEETHKYKTNTSLVLS